MRLRIIRVLGLVGCVVAGWAVWRAGVTLVVDAPRASDMILVLAGETERRPALAEVLLERGYAQRVILNVPAQAKVYDASQMDIARRYIGGLSRGKDWLLCPIDGMSTKDEAKNVERCVHDFSPNARSILVVTSDYHTRRALKVFQQQFPGWDISVAAAYDPTQFGPRWWDHRQWAKVCLDEWLRLLWWEAVDRWR